MKTAITGAIVALAALALPASAQTTENQLSDPRSAFQGTGGGMWHARVEKTERGHIIGNPEAEASLIEFISYTCGHCATFAREGEGALDLAVLAPGHMTVEVRPVIRNAIDLTVSMLVACGDTDKFKDRHRLFLMRQPQWLAKVRSAPASQQALFQRADRASRISMAAALDFDDMLASRGVSRVDINTCLSDDRAAQALIDNGNADSAEFSIPGTPSFAMDGELLTGVHEWRTLYPVIAERFRPKPSQESAF